MSPYPAPASACCPTSAAGRRAFAVTAGQGVPVPAVISGNSLADAPVLTTQPPHVIPAAATPGWGRPNAGLTSRSSLADAPVLTAQAPHVIQAAATPGW